MPDFSIGQTALDVCKTIVDRQSINVVRLLRHAVGVNWRQQYATPEARAAALMSGFEHMKPIEWREYRRRDFEQLAQEDLIAEPHTAWSMTSLVGPHWDWHIPMMNFHPEGIGLSEIEKAARHLNPRSNGALLDSGRYQHYYGNYLVHNDQWPRWMTAFLGPCVLVSPRYISHRIHHGYATLRLTSDVDFKPLVPRVVRVILGSQ